MPTIEKAIRKGSGRLAELPEWVANGLERELAEVRSIADPRQRRLREIEIDLKRDKLLAELRGEQ